MDEQALAIGLGLFSALTLALANVAVKKGEDILVGRALLSGCAGLLVLPAAFFLPLPNEATWRLLALSVPAHFFYQICLIRAMQRGDLSLVFPVMRGAAPLLTAGFAVVVLREDLPAVAWLGLVLATGAVLVFAWPGRGVSLRAHPDKAALGWALATALGIAVYNMIDASGVRTAPEPLTYIVWLFMLDPLCIVTAALVLRRRELKRAMAEGWRTGVAASLLSVLSFGSALYAYSLIEVAKVSALRETAVVWAALIGSLYLREGFGVRRIIAAVALAGGLVLLQFA